MVYRFSRPMLCMYIDNAHISFLFIWNQRELGQTLSVYIYVLYLDSTDNGTILDFKHCFMLVSICGE
jgi:hypothetical protein